MNLSYSISASNKIYIWNDDETGTHLLHVIENPDAANAIVNILTDVLNNL